MRTIGTSHKVNRIPDDSVNYLALALRARLQDLITAMIAAANHRTDAQFDRSASLYEDGSPMWSILVRSDVAKQLEDRLLAWPAATMQSDARAGDGRRITSRFRANMGPAATTTRAATRPITLAWSI